MCSPTPNTDIPSSLRLTMLFNVSLALIHFLKFSYPFRNVGSCACSHILHWMLGCASQTPLQEGRVRPPGPRWGLPVNCSHWREAPTPKAHTLPRAPNCVVHQLLWKTFQWGGQWNLRGVCHGENGNGGDKGCDHRQFDRDFSERKGAVAAGRLVRSAQWKTWQAEAHA